MGRSWTKLVASRFGETRLRVDSRLNGFDALLNAALSAASARGLHLEPATVRNLQWLGLDAEEATDAGAQKSVLPDV